MNYVKSILCFILRCGIKNNAYDSEISIEINRIWRVFIPGVDIRHMADMCLERRKKL